jgi:hypothetical protein
MGLLYRLIPQKIVPFLSVMEGVHPVQSVKFHRELDLGWIDGLILLVEIDTGLGRHARLVDRDLGLEVAIGQKTASPGTPGRFVGAGFVAVMIVWIFAMRCRRMAAFSKKKHGNARA